MAQVPVYPASLFFYCDTAPLKGGQTPIVQSDIVYRLAQKAYPEFILKLETLGVIYTRVIPKKDDPSSPIGRGWINTFGTQDPLEAQEAAKKLNVTLEWLPNGDVKTISSVLDAIKVYHPRASGMGPKKVWFNSVIAAYVGWIDARNDPTRAVTFGDGSLLDPEAIQGIQKIMQEACVAFDWKDGDVLWIDNNQVMHSR